jgi:excinuclease ABC subunit A
LEHLVDEVECSVCSGSRLRDDASAVRFRGRTMDELCRLPLGRLLEEFQNWKLESTERKIAGELVREIRNRLQFLVDVGLEYLTLARPGPTLSGGESQRIRLAAQVGSGLCGVLYVLDEPTIGLHPRDNRRLLDALYKLRDLGNTLLVVEHDREVVRSADQLLDFGPAAGRHGGQIVARGTPAQVATRRESVTGPYLSGKKAIPVPGNRRIGSGLAPAKGRSKQPARAIEPDPPGGGWLEIVGARHNNLKNLHVKIPLGTFTVVTGTSGSGKSSLVEDVLYNALARTLHRAKTFPGAHDAIRGLERVNKVIRVDQQPLGQTPTSNPATFTGVFDLIRELYACPRPSSVAIPRGGSVSTCPAGVARSARATASCASRCTSCPTCGSTATPATASVTTPRRWPSSTAASRWPTCWTCRATTRPGCSRTSPRSAASCRRCATSGWVTSPSASPPPRSPAARPSG